MVASSSKRLREGVPLLYQGINILGESIARRHFEIGRILQLKSEIRNLELDGMSLSSQVQFHISDFGFELQDSSDFKIFPL